MTFKIDRIESFKKYFKNFIIRNDFANPAASTSKNRSTEPQPTQTDHQRKGKISWTYHSILYHQDSISDFSKVTSEDNHFFLSLSRNLSAGLLAGCPSIRIYLYNLFGIFIMIIIIANERHQHHQKPSTPSAWSWSYCTKRQLKYAE